MNYSDNNNNTNNENPSRNTNITSWVECFVSILFDLDIGPTIDYIYPANVITPRGQQALLACAFPDCNVNTSHNFIYFFTIEDKITFQGERESAIEVMVLGQQQQQQGVSGSSAGYPSSPATAAANSSSSAPNFNTALNGSNVHDSNNNSNTDNSNNSGSNNHSPAATTQTTALPPALVGSSPSSAAAHAPKANSASHTTASNTVNSPGTGNSPGISRATSFYNANHSHEVSAMTTTTTAVTTAAPQRVLYGAVYYREKKDERVTRGYVQQAVVLLSRLNYFSVSEIILRVIMPKYCQCCALSPDTGNVSSPTRDKSSKTGEFASGKKSSHHPNSNPSQSSSSSSTNRGDSGAIATVSSPFAPVPSSFRLVYDPSYNTAVYSQHEILRMAYDEIVSTWPSPHPRTCYMNMTLLSYTFSFVTPAKMRRSAAGGSFNNKNVKFYNSNNNVSLNHRAAMKLDRHVRFIEDDHKMNRYFNFLDPNNFGNYPNSSPSSATNRTRLTGASGNTEESKSFYSTILDTIGITSNSSSSNTNNKNDTGAGDFNTNLSSLINRSPVEPEAFPLYKLFKHNLHHLTRLWELLLWNESVLILSDTPTTTSAAALAASSLILPVQYNGIMKPYFTVQNSDYHLYSKLGKDIKFNEQKSIVIGVTNPFFVNHYSGWKSLLVVTDSYLTRTGRGKGPGTGSHGSPSHHVSSSLSGRMLRNPFKSSNKKSKKSNQHGTNNFASNEDNKVHSTEVPAISPTENTAEDNTVNLIDAANSYIEEEEEELANNSFFNRFVSFQDSQNMPTNASTNNSNYSSNGTSTTSAAIANAAAHAATTIVSPSVPVVNQRKGADFTDPLHSGTMEEYREETVVTTVKKKKKRIQVNEMDFVEEKVSEYKYRLKSSSSSSGSSSEGDNDEEEDEEEETENNGKPPGAAPGSMKKESRPSMLIRGEGWTLPASKQTSPTAPTAAATHTQKISPETSETITSYNNSSSTIGTSANASGSPSPAPQYASSTLPPTTNATTASHTKDQVKGGNNTKEKTDNKEKDVFTVAEYKAIHTHTKESSKQSVHKSNYKESRSKLQYSLKSYFDSKFSNFLLDHKEQTKLLLKRLEVVSALGEEGQKCSVFMHKKQFYDISNKLNDDSENGSKKENEGGSAPVNEASNAQEKSDNVTDNHQAGGKNKRKQKYAEGDDADDHDGINYLLFSQFSVADDIIRKFFYSLTTEFLSPVTIWYRSIVYSFASEFEVETADSLLGNHSNSANNLGNINQGSTANPSSPSSAAAAGNKNNGGVMKPQSGEENLYLVVFQLCDQNFLENKLLSSQSFLQFFERYHRRVAPAMWTNAHSYKTYKEIYEHFSQGVLFVNFIYQLVDESLSEAFQAFEIDVFLNYYYTEESRIDFFITIYKYLQALVERCMDPDVLQVRRVTSVLAAVASTISSPFRENFMLMIEDLRL